MDKVAGGDTAVNIGIRASSAGFERKEKTSAPQKGPLDAAAVDTVDATVASVAAEAEKGKLRSLSTLQDVTESIEDAVEVLNQALSLRSTAAFIRRDDELNRYLVTIKDKESGEVVREIPDEALIKFARNLQELRGILFDETT